MTMRAFLLFTILVVLIFALASRDTGKNSAISLSAKNSKERVKLLTESAHYMKQPDATYGFAKMPIKVFINNSYYKFITEKTFYTWQRATSSLVSFEFVNDEKLADIKILFKDEVPKDNAYGYSSMKVSGATKFIESSKIELYVFEPQTGKKLPDKMIYSVLIHEIGHSLGIIDHSNNNGDIMCESAQSLDRELSISPRDINTLKIIYAR